VHICPFSVSQLIILLAGSLDTRHGFLSCFSASSSAAAAWGTAIFQLSRYTGTEHNNTGLFLIHFPFRETSHLDSSKEHAQCTM